MAMKHGFNSVEAYKEGVQKKFSLLENGIVQKPSTRLLLINVSWIRGLGVLRMKLTGEKRARWTA